MGHHSPLRERVDARERGSDSPGTGDVFCFRHQLFSRSFFARKPAPSAAHCKPNWSQPRDAAAEKANPVLDSINQSTGSQLREGTAPLLSTLGMWQVASGIQLWAVPFRKELANRSCDEKGLGGKNGEQLKAPRIFSLE